MSDGGQGDDDDPGEEPSDGSPDGGMEDPFDRLASEIDREAAFGEESGDGGIDEGAVSIGSEASDSDGTSPFDDLDADVEDVDLDELFEEAFTEAATGALDSEVGWDQLEETGPEDRETAADEHVVPVREFCAQCEYAAEPPEVHCTYEGSQIVEFVDKETNRVRNCPIVAQRRKVGKMD